MDLAATEAAAAAAEGGALPASQLGRVISQRKASAGGSSSSSSAPRRASSGRRPPSTATITAAVDSGSFTHTQAQYRQLGSGRSHYSGGGHRHALGASFTLPPPQPDGSPPRLLSSEVDPCIARRKDSGGGGVNVSAAVRQRTGSSASSSTAQRRGSSAHGRAAHGHGSSSSSNPSSSFHQIRDAPRSDALSLFDAKCVGGGGGGGSAAAKKPSATAAGASTTATGDAPRARPGTDGAGSGSRSGSGSACKAIASPTRPASDPPSAGTPDHHRRRRSGPPPPPPQSDTGTPSTPATLTPVEVPLGDPVLEGDGGRADAIDIGLEAAWVSLEDVTGGEGSGSSAPLPYHAAVPTAAPSASTDAAPTSTSSSDSSVALRPARQAPPQQLPQGGGGGERGVETAAAGSAAAPAATVAAPTTTTTTTTTGDPVHSEEAARAKGKRHRGGAGAGTHAAGRARNPTSSSGGTAAPAPRGPHGSGKGGPATAAAVAGSDGDSDLLARLATAEARATRLMKAAVDDAFAGGFVTEFVVLDGCGGAAMHTREPTACSQTTDARVGPDDGPQGYTPTDEDIAELRADLAARDRTLSQKDAQIAGLEQLLKQAEARGAVLLRQQSDLEGRVRELKMANGKQVKVIERLQADATRSVPSCSSCAAKADAVAALEEQLAAWREKEEAFESKTNECRRLRTILNFSQLKKDSDRLHSVEEEKRMLNQELSSVAFQREYIAHMNTEMDRLREIEREYRIVKKRLLNAPPGDTAAAGLTLSHSGKGSGSNTSNKAPLAASPQKPPAARPPHVPQLTSLPQAGDGLRGPAGCVLRRGSDSHRVMATAERDREKERSKEAVRRDRTVAACDDALDVVSDNADSDADGGSMNADGAILRDKDTSFSTICDRIELWQRRQNEKANAQAAAPARAGSGRQHPNPLRARPATATVSRVAADHGGRVGDPQPHALPLAKVRAASGERADRTQSFSYAPQGQAPRRRASASRQRLF